MCGGKAYALAQTPMPLVRRDGMPPCADLGVDCMRRASNLSFWLKTLPNGGGIGFFIIWAI